MEIATLYFLELIQDLLNKPFRNRAVTERHKYVNNMWAISYSQSRIVNVYGCIEKTHLNNYPAQCGE